jgi:regulator of G-protein signaling
VAETLISRGDQYAPFDALISQPDPSNPWVTDNQEYWETEKCRTDVALRRVQKWSFSLLELIKDPAGHEQFEKFLEREFSKENLK